MPGFAEHAARTGFSAHESSKPGFAQYAGRTTSYARPSVGFASAVKAYEEAEAAREMAENAAMKARRKKRPHRSERPVKEAYRFPDITVGRKIDMSEARAWRDYPQKLEMRNHGWKMGSMIALRAVTCVYFTPDEMNSALTERYKDIAHDPNDARRDRKAREICLDVTAEIQNMRRERDEFVVSTIMNVDQNELRRLAWDRDLDREQRNQYAMLYNRIEDCDYEAFDKADLAAQLLVTQPDRLWTPRRFDIGAADNPNELQFGFNLLDEERVMAAEREALIGRFSQRFGLNRLHFSDDWSPQVAFIDLMQPGVEGLQRRLAPAPIELPLKQPGAYLAA